MSSLAPLKAFPRHCVRAGINLLFPPACTFCHAELLESDDQVLVCGTCREAFIDAAPLCPRCGARVPPGLASSDCVRCRDRKLRFHTVVRLGTYVQELREAVLRTKHSGGGPLARALAGLLAKSQEGALRRLELDVVIPVPMHWSRRIYRGMSSPDVAADELGRQLRLPVAPHLLRRIRRTRLQASVETSQRLRNVRGAFRAALDPDLAGARVLLVDDIMTTGATASEAARMVQKAGARFIAVAVLARAEGA